MKINDVTKKFLLGTLILTVIMCIIDINLFLLFDFVSRRTEAVFWNQVCVDKYTSALIATKVGYVIFLALLAIATYGHDDDD